MKRRSGERGSSIIESMFCIMLLCLIFFGLLQVFQWSVAKMLCEYSSFYAAKGHSLGYYYNIVIRAARVAAMGASGPDASGVPLEPPYTRTKLSERAKDYMQRGKWGIYQVNYEYWDTSTQNVRRPAYLNINPDYMSSFASEPDYIDTTVSITNMPLLDPSLSIFLGGGTADPEDPFNVDIPNGKTRMYNHARKYLE
jgi:hypothetical protein